MIGITGSAHCSNLFAPSGQLTWLSGEEKLGFYHHPETKFARNFCSICSSTMPIYNQSRDIVIMPAGCLDTDLAITPQAHIFTDSKGNWDGILNDTVTFEKMPS
ncbi:GFA family protein [Psychromonas aquatilis]|uniref:GFA family protein n=1 Tax=Psychromonas aquatilis TaxID=2005072 RepID=A0ABU9GPU0_9GAMM